VKGLKDGLGEKAMSMIVAETPYEIDDSQVVNLKASGTDIVFGVTILKFAAQAIRKLTLAGGSFRYSSSGATI
jgi:branched-chain amino acid transport system substrate-binding protein